MENITSLIKEFETPKVLHPPLLSFGKAKVMFPPKMLEMQLQIQILEHWQIFVNVCKRFF